MKKTNIKPLSANQLFGDSTAATGPDKTKPDYCPNHEFNCGLWQDYCKADMCIVDVSAAHGREVAVVHE